MVSTSIHTTSTSNSLETTVNCTLHRDIRRKLDHIQKSKMPKILVNKRDSFRNRSHLIDPVETKKLVFELLPVEILCSLFEYLDVKSLLTVGICSSYLNSVSSRNEASWSKKCKALWETKSFVCQEARLILSKKQRFKRMKCDNCDHVSHCSCLTFKSIESRTAKEAYKISVMDAKYRLEIAISELCQITWSFRFKEAAGIEWTAWDPWWNGRSAQKMIFLADGRVVKLDSSTTINDDDVREYNFGPMNAIDIRWRFITSPLDLSPRPIGGYIRLSVGGREVPTYVVRRSPTNNWGFVMESCWGVFSSFEMPRLGKVSEMEDSSMCVTNLRQWREAFLYNNGANRLPEGKRDLEEFESIWNHAFPVLQKSE